MFPYFKLFLFHNKEDDDDFDDDDDDRMSNTVLLKIKLTFLFQKQKIFICSQCPNTGKSLQHCFNIGSLHNRCYICVNITRFRLVFSCASQDAYWMTYYGYEPLSINSLLFYFLFAIKGSNKRSV